MHLLLTAICTPQFVMHPGRHRDLTVPFEDRGGYRPGGVGQLAHPGSGLWVFTHFANLLSHSGCALMRWRSTPLSPARNRSARALQGANGQSESKTPRIYIRHLNSKAAVEKWFRILGFNIVQPFDERFKFVAQKDDQSIAVDVMFCQNEGWQTRLRERIILLEARLSSQPMLVVVSSRTDICKEALHILAPSSRGLAYSVGTVTNGVFEVMWSGLIKNVT
jgi:hypothetical protein